MLTDHPPIPDAATAKAMQAELKKLTAKYYRRSERWLLFEEDSIEAEMKDIRAEMRVIEDALTDWERRGTA